MVNQAKSYTLLELILNMFNIRLRYFFFKEIFILKTNCICTYTYLKDWDIDYKRQFNR